MSGSDRSKARAPLEWIFLMMVFTLTKRHRARFRSSLLVHYRDMYREIGSEEGFQSSLHLFVHTVWEFIRIAAEQRAGQVLSFTSSGNRLVVFGGLATMVVGLGHLADGIAAYSSMKLFPTYLDLPTHISLGILGEPVIAALLMAAGCAGIYVFLERRSALALFGIYLVASSALLTLFLGLYDWAFDPVYYSDTSFGLKSVEDVDNFAVNVLLMKTWALALGAVLLAIAACRSTKLRRWWPMLLGVGFVQSPLFERCVHSLSMLLIDLQTDLVLTRSQVIFEWPGMALFELQTSLFYAPLVIPGLTWTLLGCLLVSKALACRSERLRMSR